MPFVTYMLEPKDENLTKLEHYELMQQELAEFIDEFLPNYFISQKSLEVVIETMLDRDNEAIQSNPKHTEEKPVIKWKGNQVNFYEVIKGLIESG